MSVARAIAVVAALTLVSLAPAAADEGEKYPIWWSPRLQLESLDKIDERLRTPLFPSEDGMRVFKGEGKWAERKRATVKDCNSLFQLIDDGYEPKLYTEFRHLLYLGALCRAAIAFQRARPAKLSHVRDFVFDAEAVNYLPAMVFIGVDCYWRCRQYVANERRISLPRFEEEDLKVRVVTDIAINVEMSWSKISLEIVGRADFSGDGLEDLMVFSYWRAIGGPAGYAKYFILTRESPDAVLYVLDADEHVCKDYECTPPFFQPRVLRE